MSFENNICGLERAARKCKYTTVCTLSEHGVVITMYHNGGLIRTISWHQLAMARFFCIGDKLIADMVEEITPKKRYQL